jgi:hypothetical protein
VGTAGPEVLVADLVVTVVIVEVGTAMFERARVGIPFCTGGVMTTYPFREDIGSNMHLFKISKLSITSSGKVWDYSKLFHGVRGMSGCKEPYCQLSKQS